MSRGRERNLIAIQSLRVQTEGALLSRSPVFHLPPQVMSEARCPERQAFTGNGIQGASRLSVPFCHWDESSIGAVGSQQVQIGNLFCSGSIASQARIVHLGIALNDVMPEVSRVVAVPWAFI
jgi:hypothetical protein